jgi:putative ABC transport system permease protein
VRLRAGVPLEQGTPAIARAIGSGYAVETPERRGAQMDRLITGFAAAFDVSSFLALAMGVFVIVNVLTVAVDRRRREIGILRALGATPRQIQLLFLAESILFGAAGGLIGVLFTQALTGWFLGVMGSSVATAYGLESQTRASLDVTIAGIALGLGIVASFIGGWMPARRAARISPARALASGSLRARERVRSPRANAVGASLFVLAVALATAPLGPKTVMVLVLAAGMMATVLLAGPIAARLLTLIGPLLARLNRAAGQVAADSLRSQPRRTATTTAGVALSLAFVLGAGGYLHSTRTAFNRWADDVMTEDLIVRSSLRLAPGQQRLPARLENEILADPSVRGLDKYRTDWTTVRGHPALLVSIDTEGMLDRTRQEFTQGTEAQMRTGLAGGHQCAVSDNFARFHGLKVGDLVELPTPTGDLRLPIAAVITSFVSDRGMVLIDGELFRSRWLDDSVDGFHVRLQPDVDPLRARDALAARLAPHGPALISTRAEFVAQVNEALNGFYALTRLTIAMAVVVAFISIATALLISVIERSREIGILKALGASRAQVQGAIVLEALAVAACGLVMAIPLGSLLARFLETVVADSYAGFRLPHAYPGALLTQIVIGLPLMAAAAAWWPARQAAALTVTETVSCD